MTGKEHEEAARRHGDPGAAAFALGGAVHDPAMAKVVRHYLQEQAKLAEIQAEELREEKRLRHWSLRVRHVSDVMRLAFELSLAFIFLAIAVAVGSAIWDAAHDHSLVVEAFSVPPDLAQRGLNGQAVAAQLLDKLQAMQDVTKSERPADSYANNWGDDIKVEIPDTGVSIGEMHKLLVSWLGHETHITGEVYRTAAGLAITARAGGDSGATVTGKEGDFDALLQQAAEKVYEHTQPYRYAVYLESTMPPRRAQARALFERLVADGSPRDRAWAYIGLGVLDATSGNGRQAAADARQALALVPDLVIGYQNIDLSESQLGHDEAALDGARSAVTVLQHSGNIDISDQARRIALPQEQGTVDFALGDFLAARADAERLIRLPDYNGSVEGARQSLTVVSAQLHDKTAARNAIQNESPTTDPQTLANRSANDLIADYWMDEWSSVIARRAVVEKETADVLKAAMLPSTFRNAIFSRLIWPYVAVALAETGDFKGAHALIDQTPPDCYACVRSRGDIDAAERNWNGAAYWFAQAVKQAPSIPMAYYRWGRMLMAKGDLDGAVAKFVAAHEKGPHFADPLEAWGEALIAKNRSDLALAKFAEADKYAPNWARLHLKWGEALYWSGDKEDAKKQFATAAKLDLSAADKVALAIWMKTLG